MGKLVEVTRCRHMVHPTTAVRRASTDCSLLGLGAFVCLFVLCWDLRERGRRDHFAPSAELDPKPTDTNTLRYLYQNVSVSFDV